MIRPMGSRILVKDVVTTLSTEKRAERIGLVAVISEQEKPKPTSGVVVAIGSDPELQRNIAVGDLVSFGYLSGHHQYVNDDEFRALDFLDIITVDDGDANESHRIAVLSRYNLTDGRPARAERTLASFLSARANENGTNRSGEPSA